VTYELDELLRQVAGQSEVRWNEETYDLALAGCLIEPERSTFIAALSRNAEVGDTHAILTLGHLHADEALPLLRAAATGDAPWAPTARRALVLLGHGEEVVEAIAADAVHARAKMARVAAVLDLPRIGGPTAVAALERALGDEDYAVRSLAWSGLVEALDLDRHIRNPDGQRDASTELERLDVLISSDLVAFVRMGIDGMHEVMRRLRSGATPQELGIVWTPDPEPAVFATIRPMLFDPDAAYPVEEIARLSGVDRRWAETMIALRLEQQDPRVPAALQRLGAAWTVPALVEVADSPDTPPELRDRLAHSIDALRRQ
jgi:hypothetical protein